MSAMDFSVFLVDDDQSVLRALTRLLKTNGFNVHAFTSGRDYLAEHDPAEPGCIVLDVSMPELNGLELQTTLAASEPARPIIFITGAADIPASVKAMKAGAVDFLTKPVRAKDLLAAIAAARQKEEMAREQRSEKDQARARVDKLTPREKQVLDGVVSGLLNKQIAGNLNIATKTIKLHRGRVMQKLGARNVVDLVHIARVAEIRP